MDFNFDFLGVKASISINQQTIDVITNVGNEISQAFTSAVAVPEYGREYEEWTNQETEQLVNELKETMNINAISGKHKRSVSSILTKLEADIIAEMDIHPIRVIKEKYGNNDIIDSFLRKHM